MWRWLQNEAGYLHLPGYTFALIAAYTAWCVMLSAFDMIPQGQVPWDGTELVTDGAFLSFLAVSAFIEELMFRAPLMLVVGSGRYPSLVAVAAIALSCAFGYVHFGGISSIPVQGILGIMLSVMFLKFGGANRKLWKPLFCTTFAHLATNLAIFFVAGLFAPGP